MLKTIRKIILRLNQKPQKYKEICKTYKNSQKPDKRQSSRNNCFLKTTKNLIFKSLKTWKNLENRTIYTEDMEKSVKYIYK